MSVPRDSIFALAEQLVVGCHFARASKDAVDLMRMCQEAFLFLWARSPSGLTAAGGASIMSFAHQNDGDRHAWH
jgi:hypothetical protein